jgi:hypothetical protein
MEVQMILITIVLKESVSVMTQFMQKYNNTNIIAVNIPHRHDVAMDSKTNLEIQAFNAKLNKITKSFRHVALVEMDTTGSILLNTACT